MIEEFEDGESLGSIRNKINSAIKGVQLIPEKFVSKSAAQYQGTFATVALANTAIKNAINPETGKNFREGKVVDIGIEPNTEPYRWQGGYGDGDLKKAVAADPLTVKVTESELSLITGAVNATTGAFVTSSLLFRAKISVKGVKNINYQAFTSGSSNGVAFFDKNNAFVSGITFANGSIVAGTRVTKDVPTNAEYMWFSYTLNTTPVFDFIVLTIGGDYINQQMNELSHEQAADYISLDYRINELNTVRFDPLTLDILQNKGVNGNTGALIDNFNVFRVKIDLTDVKAINYQAFTSGTGNGIAFFDKTDKFISGVTYSLNSITQGTRVTKEVPVSASYVWFSYTINAVAISTGIPVFDYLNLIVTSKYIIKEVDKTKSKIADIATKTNELNTVRLVYESTDLVQGSGVNGNTGVFLANANVFRIKVDLTDVKAINYPVITSGSGNGIAFFDKNGTFISGSTYVNGSIVQGLRATKEVPTNASLVWITYATNGFATSSGIPIFDYVDLVVSLSYLNRRINKSSSDGANASLDRFKMWKVASLPYGSLLNLSVATKTTAFESILSGYPGVTVKTNIGKDQSGTLDMFGYTVTPPRYTTVIAITAHVHGSERISPTGFMALLAEMSKPNCNDDFLCYMRDNVKWIIVFFVNPYGSRQNSRGVNLNRNNDYRWVLNTYNESEAKGSAPNSEQETKNVTAFFKQFKDEINFHLDCHDVGTSDFPYAPANNKLFLYQSKMNAAREALETMNETPKSTMVPYVNDCGSFGNFFNENLGIPSITLESAIGYWTTRGYSNDIIVAKSAEMIAAFLCMWFNLKQNYGGQMFFERDMITAFKSEEYGINTWSWTKFHAELTAVPGWARSTIFSDSGTPVYSYTNAVTTPLKTIMVIAGEHDDDKNSAFTAMRVMQEISRSKQLGTYSYLQRIYDNIKVVIIPALNPNSAAVDWTAVSNIKTQLQATITAVNPDYVVYLDGAKDLDPVGDIVARKATDSFTTWIKANTKTSITAASGIETAIVKDRVSIKLANVVPESSRYGFAVVQWVKAVVNDIASYTKG